MLSQGKQRVVSPCVCHGSSLVLLLLLPPETKMEMVKRIQFRSVYDKFNSFVPYNDKPVVVITSLKILEKVTIHDKEILYLTKKFCI